MPASEVVQVVVVLAAAVLFGLAFLLGLQHMRVASAAGEGPSQDRSNRLGGTAVGAIVAGTLLAGMLLLWRVAEQGVQFVRLDNHFDSFLVLGLLLAAMLIYFRLTGHLRGLGFFLLPPLAVVLLVGGILTAAFPGRAFNYQSAWLWVHVFSILVGSVSFAAGCAGGIVYLVADRQLRNKGLDARHRFLALPSLATLEKFNQWSIVLGFPLLTVAMVTGILYAVRNPGSVGDVWAASPKLVMSVLAWAIYTLLLHIRFAPAFRGRRAAWLNIFGFVLLLGVYVTVNWWPTAKAKGAGADTGSGGGEVVERVNG